jgi:hypothetical protein
MDHMVDVSVILTWDGGLASAHLPVRVKDACRKPKEVSGIYTNKKWEMEASFWQSS